MTTWLTRTLCTLAAFLLLLNLAGCTGSSNSASPTDAKSAAREAAIPRVMTWKITPSPAFVSVFVPGQPPIYGTDPTTGTVRFLARSGDIALIIWKDEKVGMDGQFMLAIDPALDSNCTLSVDPDCLLVRQNGKPIGFFGKNQTTPEWNGAQRACLAKLTAKDLGSFRLCSIAAPDDSDAQRPQATVQRELIARLVEAKPQRLLVALEDDKAAAQSLPAGLNPVAVGGIDGPKPASAQMVSQFADRRLQTLFIDGDLDDALLAAVAGLPHLRSLIISDANAVRLPSNLALDKLECWAKSITGLQQQKSLTQITVRPEALLGLDLRQTFPQLVSLSTTVSQLSATPSGLRHLRFMKDAVTPDLLARVVAANPQLKSVEFVECTQLTDLSALKQLKNLESLVLLKTETIDTKTLTELKTVRFMALQAKELKSPIVDEIKAKRPDAIVVPVDGFCLGSGWLLSLIPVIALGAIIARRRSALTPAPAVV